MRITHSQKGFTLLETLVAISILLIAVVGPMSIIGRSLPQSAYARDHAIAVNLAQEGIEAVRQKRDSNMLDKWNSGPAEWDSNLTVGYYILNPKALLDMLYFCGVGPCVSTESTVRQDGVGLYYQSSAGGITATKFQRQVEIKLSASGPQEKQIISVVTWRDGAGVLHTLSVSEFISGINS